MLHDAGLDLGLCIQGAYGQGLIKSREEASGLSPGPQSLEVKAVSEELLVSPCCPERACCRMLSKCIIVTTRCSSFELIKIAL